MQNGIDGKRNLLAKEVLRYFWETCPALAARCEVAIVDLPPLARREVAGRLQTLAAVANETNRELAAARVAVKKGQASADLLLDRALASIEHLSEIAQTMTRWIDELARSKVGSVPPAARASTRCATEQRQSLLLVLSGLELRGPRRAVATAAF